MKSVEMLNSPLFTKISSTSTGAGNLASTAALYASKTLEKNHWWEDKLVSQDRRKQFGIFVGTTSQGKKIKLCSASLKLTFSPLKRQCLEDDDISFWDGLFSGVKM